MAGKSLLEGMQELTAEERAAAGVRYRLLLERNDAADAAELPAVLAALQRDPACVAADLELVRKIKAAKAAAEQLAGLQAESTRLDGIMNATVSEKDETYRRYEALVAKVDALSAQFLVAERRRSEARSALASLPDLELAWEAVCLGRDADELRRERRGVVKANVGKAVAEPRAAEPDPVVPDVGGAAAGEEPDEE